MWRCDGSAMIVEKNKSTWHSVIPFMYCTLIHFEERHSTDQTSAESSIFHLSSLRVTTLLWMGHEIKYMLLLRTRFLSLYWPHSIENGDVELENGFQIQDFLTNKDKLFVWEWHRRKKRVFAGSGLRSVREEVSLALKSKEQCFINSSTSKWDLWPGN